MAAIQVQREPDGCWVLWRRGRVVAEGRGRVDLAVTWLTLKLSR